MFAKVIRQSFVWLAKARIDEFAHNFYNFTEILAQLRKTMLFHKPQAIENSFKRPYGEVEDNYYIKT